MQQVEAAAHAHYSLPGSLPLAPEGDQLTLRNDLSQTSARRPVPEGTAEESILPCARAAQWPSGKAFVDAGTDAPRSTLIARTYARDFRCYNFCQFHGGCFSAGPGRATIGTFPRA